MVNILNITALIIYLGLGIYFLNAPFNFIPLPSINVWFIFIGGILLIFGGIKYLHSAFRGY